MKANIGNPMLPWATIPTWLRLLRVVFIAMWTAGFLSLVAGFILQFQVLDSPTIATGLFTHSVEFKGGIFYVTTFTYRVWTSLQVAIVPLWGAGAGLMIANIFFENRIKKRLWEAQFAGMAKPEGL